MKRLIYILFLFSCLSYGQTIRYVTVSGGGNGTSTTNTWTLSQGIANATCDMIIYVQEGNYGSASYSINRTCSTGEELEIIGVDENWNEITLPTRVSELDGTTHTRATYTRTDTFSGNDLPFLDSGLQVGQRASGNGLTIGGKGIIVKNFAIRGYAKAVYVSGSNHYLENINADFSGYQTGDNSYGFSSTNCCAGYSIDIPATNSTFINIFGRDGSHAGIQDGGGNNTFKYVEYYTSRFNSTQTTGANTTDYQILMNGGYSTFDYIYNIRELLTVHLSHGLVIKPQSGESAYNAITNYYCENSKIELQGLGAHHNTFKNGLLVNTSTNFSDDYAATMLNFINGASNNTVENAVLWQPTWTVQFEDFNEGYANDANFVGDGNTFINVVGINPWSAHFAFNERNGKSNSNATNTNFYHTTLIGGNLTYNNNMNGGMTGGMYNSIWTGNSIGNGSALLANSFVFDKINTPANLSAYTESNITSNAFSFVDAMANVSENLTEFNYAPSNTVLNIGANRNSNAPETLQGNTRNSTPSLGAYGYGEGAYLPDTPTIPIEPTLPLISKQKQSGNQLIMN